MKVNSPTNQAQKTKKNISREDILAKVKSKFGDKAAPKKTAPKEKVEVSKNAKQKEQVESKEFGDIGKNDPNSDMTKEKLRGILKTGAFNFSDAERSTLNDILN